MIGLRDFWQNFAREPEVDADAGEMRIHLRPDHGKPRMETTGTLSDENAWRLPWVHSGEARVSTAPKVLDDNNRFPGLNSHAGEGCMENMYMANAIGISRTHDLLMSFCPASCSAVAAGRTDSYFDEAGTTFPGVPGIRFQEPAVNHHLASAYSLC